MTPAKLSARQAFEAIVDREGKDEAHSFLVDLGDDLSLWPETPVFEDIDKRAAQVIAEAIMAVPFAQRSEMIRALAKHSGRGLRVLDAAQADRVAA